MRSWSLAVSMVLAMGLAGCPPSSGGPDGSSLDPPDLSCTRTRRLGTYGSPAGASTTLVFAATDCQGRPIGGLTRDQFKVEEDDRLISSESLATLVPEHNVHLFTTLVLDMSSSTGANLAAVIAGAKAFVNKLRVERQLPVQISIELFAGDTSSTVWVPHTLDTARLLLRLDELASFQPTDPDSTNLYGAIIEAQRRLGQAETAFSTRNGGGALGVGFLVVFTDGRDTAAKATLAQAMTCLDRAATPAPSSVCQNRMLVGGPGNCDPLLTQSRCSPSECCQQGTSCFTTPAGFRCQRAGSDIPCDAQYTTYCPQTLTCSPGNQCCCSDAACVEGFLTQTCGPDRGRDVLLAIGLRGADFDSAALEEIATGGLLTVDDASLLERDFAVIAEKIASQLSGIYLLGYCSPSRSGTHELSVEVANTPSQSAASIQFVGDSGAAGCSAATFLGQCDGKTCAGFACGACDDSTSWCDTAAGACRSHCERDAGTCALSYTTNLGYAFTCADSPRSTACGSSCTDLTGTDQHCGACDNACRFGSCVGGSCVCPGNQVGCGTACRSVATDPENCGGCDNQCPRRASCTAGTCGCRAGDGACDGGCEFGELKCNGFCVDLENNGNHCGACGVACNSGRCARGACVTSCANGVDFKAPEVFPLPGARFAVAGEFVGDGLGGELALSRVSYIDIFKRGDAGALQLWNSVSAGDTITGLLSGDLSGDGRDELVVRRQSGDLVVIEDLTLRQVATGVGAVAIADFDGDGQKELVVSENGQLRVRVRSDGGTFAPRGLPLSSFSSDQLFVADLNGDRLPDIAEVVATAIRTQLSLADGGFTQGAPVAFPADGGTPRVVVADFNADGRSDFAFARPGAGGVSVSLSGPMTFSAWVAHPAPSFFNASGAIAAGDVNGDGRPDLLTAGQNGLEAVAVFLNDGAGAFAPGVLQGHAPHGAGLELLVSDWDGDGRVDAVIPNSGRGTVSLLRGLGDGQFESPRRLLTWAGLSALEVHDLNRDGRSDLIGGTTGMVAYRLALADGGLGAPVAADGGACRSIAAADLTADGLPDLICGGDGVSVFALSADGGIAQPVTYPRALNLNRIIVSDFDRDGLADVMSSEPAFFRGRADGGLAFQAVPAVSGANLMTAVDMNADGLVDVAAISASVLTWIVQGAPGSFAPMTTASDRLNTVASADLDGDHRDDLVLARNAGINVTWGTDAGVSLAGGMGYATPFQPVDVTFADLNGDGVQDFVIVNNDAEISVLLSTGPRSYGRIRTYGATRGGKVRVADWNGDGLLDIVGVWNNEVTVLESTCR